MLLTQEELAEQLGISVKHFSEVERGLTGLSIENLIQLSGLLGLSLDYMLKGEEQQTNWDSVIAALQRLPKSAGSTEPFSQRTCGAGFSCAFW